MQLTQKLADLITGGKYSDAKEENMRLHSRCQTYKMVMQEIASMETPSANATVKRMADKARGAVDAG